MLFGIRVSVWALLGCQMAMDRDALKVGGEPCGTESSKELEEAEKVVYEYRLRRWTEARMGSRYDTASEQRSMVMSWDSGLGIDEIEPAAEPIIDPPAPSASSVSVSPP